MSDLMKHQQGTPTGVYVGPPNGGKPISYDQKRALQSFKQLTNSWCDVWDLMGDRNADHRADIMSKLCGKPMPKAKCGVTALREELMRVLGVADGSAVAVRDEIYRKITEVLG